MKVLTLLAISSLALAGHAAAADAKFDLRFDQESGQRTISVANSLNGAFAVAAGREDLDLLKGADAEVAFKRLRARPDVDIEFDDRDADREHDAAGKRKIVIHKMDYDEDDSGDDEKREVRIIRRHRPDADASGDASLEGGPETDDEMEFELADGRSPTERRVIYINAADRPAAAKFIDRIKGLDDAEKAAMKEAVGL